MNIIWIIYGLVSSVDFPPRIKVERMFYALAHPSASHLPAKKMLERQDGSFQAQAWLPTEAQVQSGWTFLYPGWESSLLSKYYCSLTSCCLHLWQFHPWHPLKTVTPERPSSWSCFALCAESRLGIRFKFWTTALQLCNLLYSLCTDFRCSSM